MAPTMYPPPDGPKNKKMSISLQGRERSRPAARLRPTVQKIIIVRVLGTHPPSGAEPKNKKKTCETSAGTPVAPGQTPYKKIVFVCFGRVWVCACTQWLAASIARRCGAQNKTTPR